MFFNHHLNILQFPSLKDLKSINRSPILAQNWINFLKILNLRKVIPLSYSYNYPNFLTFRKVVPLLSIFLVLFSSKTFAQYPTGQPPQAPQTPDSAQVQILNSRTAEFILYKNETVRKLKGNVKLQQKDAILYCDSCILDNQNNVYARGNVVIEQGDSVKIWADSARYFGFIRNADLFGDVILENNSKKLFTEKMHYDFNTKIATYNTKASLVDESTQLQLTSRRGQFNTQTNEAFFKDQVLVVDKSFDLKTDTLRFNTKTNTAFFLAPTLIYMRDTAQFYTEEGFYDLTSDLAEFTKTPQYKKRDQVATSDTMYYNGKTKEITLQGNAFSRDRIRNATANRILYNRETEKSELQGNAYYKDDKQEVKSDTVLVNGKTKTYSTRGRSNIVNGNQILQADFVDFIDSMGIAKGKVVWRDTSSKTTISCENMAYDQRTDYIKATGKRPVLTSLIDNDTLWLRADTIISFKPNIKDSARTLLAYFKVRIYKSNFQSLCDSLSFSESDSTFRLFKNPIVWQDTSQMTADTMRIILKDKKIERVFMKQNALIINSKDELYYNQIKGRQITAFFEGDDIRRMFTEGNAESIYYALDNANAYINANKVDCSEMMIYFGNNKVDKIKFFTQPQAKALPMKTTNHDEIKLKGFRWDIKLRPKSLKDL
jgi:lipopolysaccharide export system protein LptA